MGVKPLFDVTVKGVALETKGLTEWDTIDGLGLLTYGLIWGCQNIWYPGCKPCEYATLTTWTLSVYAGATTVIWTEVNSGGGVTISPTTWVPYSTEGVEEC